MSHVIAPTADESALPESRPRLVRLNDLNRTSQQIKVLLSVIATSQSMLITSHEVAATVEINPAAAKAAEQTYELANIRMRDIIDEQVRWSATDSDADRYTERLAEANLRVTELQKSNLEIFRRPSRVFNASVRRVRLQNGRTVWAAFLGQAPSDDGVLGLGESPESALQAFDEAFSRKIEQQTPDAAAPPAAPEPTAPPDRPPQPRKNSPFRKRKT